MFVRVANGLGFFSDDNKTSFLEEIYVPEEKCAPGFRGIASFILSFENYVPKIFVELLSYCASEIFAK